MYQPLVLITRDFSSYEPVERGEEFENMMEAMESLSELFFEGTAEESYGNEPTEEEEGVFLDSLYDLTLGDGLKNKVPIFFTKSCWLEANKISPIGLGDGYLLPVSLVPVLSSNGTRGVLYSIYTRRRMTFPVFVQLNNLYSSEAVFVPLSPEEFGVSLEEDREEGSFVFFKAYSSEEVEAPDIYGFYPWDVSHLPTAISLFYRGRIGKEGPVSLLLTPDFVELNGGIPKVIRMIQGYETLGMQVLVSFGEFFYEDDEEEEEEDLLL